MADRINLKRITHHLWKHWVRPIGLVVIVLGTFRAAVADWNDVPSGSMNPTILVGDRIVVNKLAFGLRVPLTHTWITQWGGPARGDVVICHASPNDKRLVKRVIGLPGDVVELRNNIVLINGSPAAYTPLEQATIDVIDPKQRPRHQFARESLGPESHPIMVTPRIKVPPRLRPRRRARRPVLRHGRQPRHEPRLPRLRLRRPPPHLRPRVRRRLLPRLRPLVPTPLRPLLPQAAVTCAIVPARRSARAP
jgi:signal peptidase I